MVNDLYVRKAEKKKIVFKSTDIVLPNLYEAIQGQIKVMPIWKKEGSIWVELTQ